MKKLEYNQSTKEFSELENNDYSVIIDGGMAGTTGSSIYRGRKVRLVKSGLSKNQADKLCKENNSKLTYNDFFIGGDYKYKVVKSNLLESSKKSFTGKNYKYYIYHYYWRDHNNDKGFRPVAANQVGNPPEKKQMWGDSGTFREYAEGPFSSREQAQKRCDELNKK